MRLSESRRDFLANAAVAVTVLPGLGIAASHALRFLVPSKGGRMEEVYLGKLSELAVKTAKMLKNVHGNALIAVRLADDDVRVFSSVCTHLGCSVHWDPAEDNFLCPCHSARFDTTGKVLSGPPESPLPSYQVRVDGDSIFVTVPVREA